MSIQVTQKALEQISLFTGLPSEALAELAARCELLTLEQGETLFEQNDESTTMYLIQEGQIEIRRKYDDGESLVLSIYGAGEIVGEMSAISHEPRAASGVAIEPTILIALHSDVLLDYLKQYPAIAIAVMTRLTRRMREINLRLREIGANNGPARIAGLLLFLAEEQNNFRTGLITTQFSMIRIARAASVDIQFLETVLSEWNEEGYIGLDGRRFLLHDPDELKQIAGW